MPYTPWLTEGNRPNRSVIARSRRNVSPVRIPLCIYPSVFRSGLFRFIPLRILASPLRRGSCLLSSLMFDKLYGSAPHLEATVW